MIVERYLKSEIEAILKRKMAFVGGPRQVGKTTLCLSFLNPPSRENPAYLNWDDVQAKSAIKKGLLPPASYILLDEIHKYKNWRNLIKGFYDKYLETKKFIVTGSAKLNHYRRGGDSLFGRYHYVRLHPFSIAELKIKTKKDLELLFKFGGFPEPFFSGSEKISKQWKQERLYQIIHDDLRDLENVRQISKLESLAEQLPEKIGSPLSVQALAEEIEVSFKTVESWLTILESIYYCFRIAPYGSPKIRAVKKEKKLYLWDWSSLLDPGAQFENCVASHLLKYCHFIEDSEGDSMELRFLRDTAKREIDFIVLKNKKPVFAVECKAGEKAVSPNIYYFKQRTKIPKFYQVHLGEKDYQSEDNIRVLPFITFSEVIGLV